MKPTKCTMATRAVAMLIAGLIAGLFPAHGNAGGIGSAHGKRASVGLKVFVAAVMKVTGVLQPDRLTIDERDLARGYVDLDHASSFLLKSNTPGFTVTANFDAALLSSVAIRMPGQANAASHAPAYFATPTPGDELVHVGYRLYLNPAARPGTYRWPVTLTFAAQVA